MVQYTHEQGQKIGIWTINTESAAQKYNAWKVDYLTTDYYDFVSKESDIPSSFD
jgi:glycerophosphoryl diester phosphodiesterase